MKEPVAIVMEILFLYFLLKHSFFKNLDFNYSKKAPSDVGFNMNELLLGSRSVLSLGMGRGWHLCDLSEPRVKGTGFMCLLCTSSPFTEEALHSAPTN